MKVLRAREVVTELDAAPDVLVHRDQIIVEAAQVAEESAGGDWFGVEALAELRLTAVAGRALGRAVSVLDHRVESVSWAAIPGASDTRRQRFAAYGFATDPAGNILLTLIAEGYPGAGRWHLPGGGTDFGETAEAGLVREIVEETGQHGEIGPLLSVSHRHQPDIRGPEQVSMDWHGIRVVYRVRVAEPTEPQVMDGGGSTAAAGWFAPTRAAELPLTEVAMEMVQKVTT
jgi:ADP-ribose pyrophosphatase YjhB (NUDIX family)